MHNFVYTITKHPDYLKRAHEWQKVRDFDAGQEVVKSRGQQYLVPPPDINLWSRYLRGAVLLELVHKTKSAYLGVMTRKDPMVELPEGLSYMVDNVDDSDTSIYQFISLILTEIILTGRGGVLTDIGKDGLPILKFYKAEDITNWSVSNDGILQFLELIEHYEEVDNSTVIKKNLIKRFYLTEGGLRVKIIKENLETESTITNINGEPLEFIPFSFINVTHNKAETERPILMPLTNVSESHYNTWAKYEHILYINSFPILFAKGGITEGDIKPGYVVRGEENSDLKYVSGLVEACEPIEKQLKNKFDNMVALGADIISSSSAANETAEAARIRQSSKLANLTTIANTISNAMTKALEVAAKIIMEDDKKVEVILNRNFIEARVEANLIRELTESYMKNMISIDAYLEQLRKFELIDDVNKEKERLENDRRTRTDLPGKVHEGPGGDGGGGAIA